MFEFITAKKFSVSKPAKVVKVEFTIEEVPFVLVNLYNANTEVEQLNTLCKLDLLNDSKHIIFAADLNLFFDSYLEASGGFLTLKKVYFEDLTTYREI